MTTKDQILDVDEKSGETYARNILKNMNSKVIESQWNYSWSQLNEFIISDEFHIARDIENGSSLFSVYNGNNTLNVSHTSYDKIIERVQIEKEKRKTEINERNEKFFQRLKEVDELDKIRIREEKVRKRNKQCPNHEELFKIAQKKEDTNQRVKIKFYKEDGRYELKEISDVINIIKCYEEELHLKLVPLITYDCFTIFDSRLKIVLDIIYLYNEIEKAKSKIEVEQLKILEYKQKIITFIEEKGYNDALFDYQESLESFNKINMEFWEKYGEKYDLDKGFIKEESPIITELKKIVTETSYYTEEEKNDIIYMLDVVMPFKVKKFLKGDFKNKYKPLLHGIRQNAFGKRIDDINNIKKEKDKIAWKLIVPIRRFQSYEREINKYQSTIENSQFHIDFANDLIIEDELKKQKKIKWLYTKIQALKNHEELELIMQHNWKEDLC